MRKFIVLFSILELLIIGVLIFTTYKKKTASLISTNTINKKEYITSPSGKLKYFYEPKSNNNISYPILKQGSLKYTINSDSLNERYDYLPGKQNSAFRIVTIGDSFTFGFNVATRDNWTELLEDKLNNNFSCTNIKKFEVINLGVSGYDNEYAVERYNTRGLKYDPDLIIWLQVDPIRVNEYLIPVMEKLAKTFALSKKIPADSDIFNPARDEIIKNFGIEKLLAYNKDSMINMNSYYKEKMIIMPISSSITDESELRMLKDVSVSQKWYYFDGLKNVFNPSLVFDDFHPNEKGHKVIAEDIFNYIKKSKFIPCN